jgi:hypothetical protein
MGTDIREDPEWQTLLSFVPGELDELAKRTGAVHRWREVRSGSDLLRLCLVYSDDEMSLRMTSAWSRSSGIAELSDVGVLKRLRQAPEFLRAVASSLFPKARPLGTRLRIKVLDATTISRQRTRGGDYRVHLTYDLSDGLIAGVELTDVRGAERLDRAFAGSGDVVVADRGYPSRKALHAVSETGAQVVIRIHPGSVPMRAVDGSKVDPLDLAGALEVGGILDVAVETSPRRDVPAVRGRLVAIRKAPEAMMRERRRLKRRAKEDRRKVGAAAVAASRFVFLFTTLTQEQADAATILEAYRMRWQIEMLFKRAKGIVSLGELAAKDHALCEATVLAKLVTMLLIQAFEAAFSPWGYPLRGSQSLARA